MGSGTSPAAAAIDVARRRGARAAEALLRLGEGVLIDVARGKVAASHPHKSSVLTVRAWVEGGGEGVATGAIGDVESVATAAVQAASVAPADPHAGPVGRMGVAAGGLGIDDRRHAQITAADRAEVVAASEKGARAVDKRVRTEGFAYRDERAYRLYTNTRGVVLDEWSTTYEARGTVLLADDRGDITLTDELASRAFASIASLPFGTSLAQRAVALAAGGGPTLEGPVRVVLSPRPLAQMFARFGPLFSAASLRDGDHIFARAARDGTTLFDPRMHLLDDGTVPGSLRTHAFDDQGVVPVPIVLIREGKVDARLLDVREARLVDARPTGHVHGGTLRPNNLILRGGTRSVNAVLSEIDGPILIVDHVYDWSGLDVVSGRWRAPVGGTLTRRSRPEGVIRRVVLDGLLSDVFSRVIEIAADTDRHGHVDAPAMLLDGFVAVS
jgi:PmbA protein